MICMIKIRRKLNRERIYSYKFVIRVMDNVSFELKRFLFIKEIIVVLKDANDNKFRFVIVFVVVVVSNLVVNDFIIIVLVKDVDIGVNGMVDYIFKSGDINLFRLDFNIG